MNRLLRVWRSTLAAAALLASGPAQAREPEPATPNACENVDQHGDCSTDVDCRDNEHATICVEHVRNDPTSRRCEIPCETADTGTVERDQSQCATGETCVEAYAQPSRKAFYCKPSAFRVDLNLLDECVTHHLEGLQPVFSDDQCSLDANLTRLLDQNQDGVFDIFDLDLCILAFLEQPGCDPTGQSCEADDLVGCASDDDCGDGLYCGDRHTCQRDCGIVASREPGLGEELERKCSGNGKVCDYTRGQCVAVDVTQSTCEADSDCPSGANCFLGRCAPQCYRSADCPSGGWYCTANNRCRVVPLPGADGGFQFDPQNYAIRFVRDRLRLDSVQTTERSAMLVLDLITKKTVVGNPSVSFGYRLETSYALKQDTKCFKPFVDCTDSQQRQGESQQQCQARQADCFIDDTEQWITLQAPFGRVTTIGDSDIAISLDQTVAERLTPGIYSATIRVIFDNGDSDSIPVTFTKASPSGEYDGQLTVYKGSVDHVLNGTQPMGFAMRLKVYGDQPAQWNTLLAAYHLAPNAGADAQGFVDVTSGLLVHGQLHGKSAFAFARPGVTSQNQNEIPFVGLYSPQLGRMRVIGVIDMPKDFCVSENGACNAGNTTELQVRNPFGRPIRRQIELIGPFDPATARFHGIYREKISGLAADFDITLEGGFILDQTVADDSDVPVVPDDVLTADKTAGVAFPSNDAVLADIDKDIATYCVDATKPAADPAANTAAYAKAQFASKTAILSYLGKAKRFGPPAPFSALGRTTIFPDVRQFKDNITEALSAIGARTAQDQRDQLSIYDFLSSFTLPCEASSASPPPVCVNESAVRCGLALHRKAIIENWLDLDAVSGGPGNPVTGDLDLFCPDTLQLAGCPADASSAPMLFALQEHNRFWSDAEQIVKLDADKARSDAFLVLFRNDANIFTASAALSYKLDRERHAVQQYDRLLKDIVGPAAAKVLFRFPARAFKQAGFDWLKIMQTIASDRLDAIADLVDIERRITLNTGATDYIFADEMMQNEYLVQVYLMALQEAWQKELFSYRGEAQSVFQRGQAILNQLNPAKNSLGVTPARVFFENSNTARSNWLNYHDRVVGEDGTGGLVGDAHAQVDEAVDNLKSSLSDLDTLEGSLFESRQGMQGSLNDLCGDSAPGDESKPSESYCQQLLKQFQSGDDWKHTRDCALIAYINDLKKDPKGFFPPGYVVEPCGVANPPFNATVTCSSYTNQLDPKHSNDCVDVVTQFIAATDDINDAPGGLDDAVNTPPTCALTDKQPTVDIDGKPRPCVGGEMGGLLQEQALTDLQRRIVVHELENLLRRILGAYQMLAAQAANNADHRHDIIAYESSIAALNLAINGIEAARDAAETGENKAECLTIIGTANGTDCLQKFIGGAALIGMKFVLGLIQAALAGAQDGLQVAFDVHSFDSDVGLGVIEGGANLQELEREVDGLIDEYNVLTQTSFNLETQMADVRYRAQEAVRMYDDQVTFVAEHLVGRESGNYLLGQMQVRKASETFREVVQQLYRMTVAFIHNYNVSPGDAAELVAQAQSIVTLQGAEDFVAALDARAQQYCAMQGLDCDYQTNTETLRFSLRDNLFPNLRDITDPRTGQVLTAGQQFYNLITRPPFLKRRIRANQQADEIEIPFSIPLDALENTKDGTPRWLIDPLSCNHLLDQRDPTDPTSPEFQDSSASQSGDLAVNFVGEALDDGGGKVIRYQLARGPTDFIRACQPESVVQQSGTLPVVTYPIRKHVIGYAPQTVEGSKDSPASFASVSQPFTACVNTDESFGTLDGGTCWRFFARDRSLASPDWKLIIPLNVGGAKTDSAWIADADAPAGIDDIILYFRYRDRPIEER